MNRAPNNPWGTAYYLAVGAVAWALLATASTGLLGDQAGPPFVGLMPVLPFAVFGLVARALAVRPMANVSLSLDTAFYIAAVLTVGALPAAWLVTITVTLDTAARLIVGATVRDRSRNLGNALAYLLARGAVPGAIVVAVCVPFGFGRPGDLEAITVLWLVPLLSVCLLLPAYGWIAFGLWLEGHPGREVLVRVAGRGLLAEFLVLPLAMVVVLVYDPRAPLPFLLLGVTFVLVNLVVKLLADALSSVHSRLVELEVLGEVGRAIAGNLQLHELIPQVARETIKLVGRTSKCMIALTEEGSEQVDIEVFDERGALVEKNGLPRGHGLTGQVMSRKETLLLNDVQREAPRYGLEPRYNDPSIHSWMGTPLVVYDEVIGMLNVQSEQARAYNDDQARVFETIAAQASVAIQNARLYELATVDGLTRLYVRRYFDLRIGEEIQVARRYAMDFSVLLLDLDDFKAINDRHGHPTGDKILREIARVMRGCMRDSDIPCRYGGEEFAVIMPRTSLAEAAAVAERIRRDVADHRIVTGGQVFSVTVSIGAASYATSGSPTAGELVDLADAALYRAKHAGKNRVELAAEIDVEKETKTA